MWHYCVNTFTFIIFNAFNRPVRKNYYHCFVVENIYAYKIEKMFREISVLHSATLVRWCLNTNEFSSVFPGWDYWLLTICTSFFENCTIHLHIYWLDYLFFWCLIFGALYTLYILIPCQMNSSATCP
jgi:hypothetical protein